MNAKSSRAWISRALAFMVLIALFWGARVEMPQFVEGAGPLAALGFLLLGGTLLSELVDVLGLPHLSGYLLCGVLVGPHGLGLVDVESVHVLSRLNTLALALIAFAGGAELRLAFLRKSLRSQSFAAVSQTLVVGVLAAGVFAYVVPGRVLPSDTATTVVLAMSVLWGVVAISRSPAAVLGIYAQVRPVGPLAEFTLAFVMLSDVVVVVLLSVVIAVVEPMLVPGAVLAWDRIGDTLHELVGSVALGTTVGLVLIAYLRFVNRQPLLVLLAFGLGVAEVLHVLRFDPLLTYIVAGFVVQNVSQQGQRLLQGVEALGGLVFVVFFATAGAHLDVAMLLEIWPVAALLCATRASATWGAAKLSSRMAKDPPVVRRLGATGLISQAGLTLGLATLIADTFPSIGGEFRTLAIATVAINEVVGPVLLKWSLDRAGESDAARRAAAS